MTARVRISWGGGAVAASSACGWRCGLRSWPLKLLVCLSAVVYCGAALAAVSCEQLADIALAAQRLRDQGYSLTTILAEFDQPAMSGKFLPAEIYTIKAVVQQSFTSELSPLEILRECKADTGR